MEIPDFLNVDCSEDEDAEDAAELEALLYSKIYYEDTVGDTETSVKLYIEAEEKRPPDSGLGSSRDEETLSSHNSTPIINNDVTSFNNDVTGGDSDVIVIDSDDEQTGLKQPQEFQTPSAVLQSNDQGRRNKPKTPASRKENTENDKNQPGSSKSSNALTTKKSQFNVDEFISNVFDINKIKEKNPFYVDNDESDDDDESDTTETTEESEDVLVCSSSSGNETSRYTENNKTAGNANESSRQHLAGMVNRPNKMSESSSSSSEEDEGIQIIREVDVALERSLRAEVVDLIESENSEVELEDINASQSTSKKKPKESQFTLATSKTKKGAEVVKSNLALSREKARAGKIVVESTSIEKSKPKRHFVAQMDFSSDSSSSSSSSDSEPSFSTPSRLSLNLTGGSIGRGGSLLRTGQNSFHQITGMLPGSHSPSKNMFASWTPEMANYYNELDPEMADVTMDDLIASFPEGANWSVGARDRYSSPGARGGRRRYFNSPSFLTCSICGQKGHRPNNCTRRGQDQRKCFMCGGDDHSKFSCPKMMCLRCGQPGMPYTSTCNRCRYVMETDCRHCGGRGHFVRNCPDHWRRYHLTTEPGHIVKPDNVRTDFDFAAIWCPNCGRRGHYVHQCRAFSSSQHPKSVLSVVSYEESRKRKFIDEENQEDNFQPKESDSVRRKRLKLELKEKRRAYNSYPHTPSIGAEKTEPNNRRNNSEPASPIDPNLNISVFSVTRNLTEAKEKLIQLTKEKFSKKKKKKKEKKRINPRGELEVTPKQFPKKIHVPQSFPRGPVSRKKPRHNTEFSPHTNPTNRNRRSVERLVGWKNSRKEMRLKEKKGRGETENFIKI